MGEAISALNLARHMANLLASSVCSEFHTNLLPYPPGNGTGYIGMIRMGYAANRPTKGVLPPQNQRPPMFIVMWGFVSFDQDQSAGLHSLGGEG